MSNARVLQLILVFFFSSPYGVIYLEMEEEVNIGPAFAHVMQQPVFKNSSVTSRSSPLLMYAFEDLVQMAFDD